MIEKNLDQGIYQNIQNQVFLLNENMFIKLLLKYKCDIMQAYLLGYTVQIKLKAKLKILHLEQCIGARVTIVHFVIHYVLQIVRALRHITLQSYLFE